MKKQILGILTVLSFSINSYAITIEKQEVLKEIYTVENNSINVNTNDIIVTNSLDETNKCVTLYGKVFDKCLKADLSVSDSQEVAFAAFEKCLDAVY